MKKKNINQMIKNIEPITKGHQKTVKGGIGAFFGKVNWGLVIVTAVA